MREMDPIFEDDGDLEKGPQPINQKWYVGEGFQEWDGRFNEKDNSEEGCGSIYEHIDDEKVTSSLDVCIDHIVNDGVLVKKRKGMRKNLRKFWEKDLKWTYQMERGQERRKRMFCF